ncbi:MAG: VWA domain-containing protein [Pirellulaceae bacterium]
MRAGRRFRIDLRHHRGINLPTDEGIGPDFSGDQFEPIYENEFQKVTDSPLSTFSIDVDTASYAKVRQYLLESKQLPRPDAVRIEELINYFSYRYDSPTTDDPFSSNMEIASCPWKPEHRLVRIGLQGKQYPADERPATNLVFLLDVSGSMDQPNKLPLLKKSMKLLVNQLGENDRVAIVVYAGAAGLVLDSTTADQKPQILAALDELHAGGSTNGGEGIRLAYQTALDHFIKGGSNRVILCTDGDFNVGTTGTDELVRLAEQNAKTGVFLSVFGFGMGNHNDSMLEQISNKGNGNYGFIDNEREAKKAFVEQLTGTLVTIAKDVKIQIEFNPQEVSAYRLIGYENRILAAQDFNDDTKDAGEIGAGHTVTALYEIIPAGAHSDVNVPPIDELKYQQKPAPAPAATDSGELLTLKIRYKQPDGDTSKLLSFPITDSGKDYAQSSTDYRFAAAVASFGMMLRDSKFKGNATWDSVLELAVEGSRNIDDVYRTEFVELVKQAKTLAGAGESKPTPASRGAGRLPRRRLGP